MSFQVILLLAVVAVESTHLSRRPPRRLPVVFPQRGEDKVSASSLGGAPVGIYSHTRGRPAFVRRRFPAFFPQSAGEDVYASSLGGAPVGVYTRDHRQKGRLVRPRFPVFRQPVDDVYAASLGGAEVGVYRRGDKGRRGLGADVSGASLGKAPVGLYSRE